MEFAIVITLRKKEPHLVGNVVTLSTLFRSKFKMQNVLSNEVFIIYDFAFLHECTSDSTEPTKKLYRHIQWGNPYGSEGVKSSPH